MTESAQPTVTDPATPFSWYEAALLALLASLAFFLSANTCADTDVWGHIKFGQDIWSTGVLVQHDRYSYLSQGQIFMDHEWLTDVVFNRAYALLGFAGLNLLKVLLILPLIICLYVSIVSKSKDSTKAFLLVFSSLMLMKIGTQVVRAHLFTYLFLGATLFVLDKLQDGKYRWLLLLAPIFILWANLHGGFLAGVAVICMWAAASVIELLRDRAMAKNAKLTRCYVIGGALLISVLSTLINPFGMELLTFLLKTATVARPDITEWEPVRLTSWEGLYYLLFAALTAAILFFNQRKPRLPDLAIWAALAIGPLSAYRHLPLMSVACCFIAGKYIAGFPPNGVNLSALIREKKTGYAVLAVLASLVFIALGVNQFDKMSTDDFPEKAVKLLKDSHAKGNLACFFDWGDYVIWELGPEVKVCMDGRRETVYSPEIRKDYASFLHGEDHWDKIVDNNGTNLVLVSKTQSTSELMKHKAGWTLVYEDKLCNLFCKQDDPLLAELKHLSPTENRLEK